MTRFNRILLTTIALSIMFSFSIFTLFIAISSEPSVEAILIDYDENFYLVVTYSTYDSDSDGYVDSFTLQMDVDTWLYTETPGEYVDVTVEGELYDPDVYLVDSNYTTWLIYGDEPEYGYLDLTATSGDPGYYEYYIDLYDDLANWEDSWFGSVYLYPLGYGIVSDDYESFYSVSYSTFDSDSDRYDDSVTLTVDADTTSSYSYVTIYGDLIDPDIYLVDSNYTTWLIYGDETEYGYLDLTATSGDPGYYEYYLDLYDDLANWEDSWSGSVYLYPIGYGVVSDHYESFYSVAYSTFDSDSDRYDDSVTLTVDVDTTSSYSYVTIYGDLIDPDIYLVDSNYTTWLIYGDETEYGYLDLTATSGDPGYYEYYLDLYDDLANWEDSWSGSVYLYPIGYGITPTLIPTPTPTKVPTLIPTPPLTPSASPTPKPNLTPTPTPTPSPDGGGLSGGLVGGIVAGALIVTVPGLLWANKSTKRRRVTNAQIRELKTQMELWREEGYDVSELENLFK